MLDSLKKVTEQIIACERCPRLVLYRQEIAHVKKREFREWDYWGRPVPGFGDPQARLLVIGLAPAAHGGNRTGRTFTGDSSGNWLYLAMHETGFANQPHSVSRDDGMRLTGAYINAAVRCAPPANKPLPAEFQHCREYMERELALLKKVRVVVALGRIAFDQYLGILRRQGKIASRGAYRFEHGATYPLGPGLPVLVSSYHPSKRNTQTGKMTWTMFLSIFRKAQKLILAERRCKDD